MLKLVLNPTYLRFYNAFEIISQHLVNFAQWVFISRSNQAFVNKLSRIVSPTQSPFTTTQFPKLQNGKNWNPVMMVNENQTSLFNKGFSI